MAKLESCVNQLPLSHPEAVLHDVYYKDVELIDVYVCTVLDNKRMSDVLKQLCLEAPMPDYSHLKRVKSVRTNDKATLLQDILAEVRNFIAGASHDRKVSHESLTSSALCLLQTLPVARHAVLEHLANVFDEAVNVHIIKAHPQAKNIQTDTDTESLDKTIKDACGVLFSFIKNNPSAWAPIISTWTLELLGHLSCKYAGRPGMPNPNSLNELLQQWMTCFPTKSLIEVATECFAAMVTDAPDVCVDALLESSVKYSPHFDWVVAHIGSCFPHTIITRVLMCGLKDYCHHGNRESSDPSMEEKIPKMASVVGILGHLASKHGQAIRNALMKLFEESMKSNSEVVKVTTLPFLLQLASMSQTLLQVLTSDLIKFCTPKVLNKLHEQFLNFTIQKPEDFESMMLLVIHLLMRIDNGAFEVIDFILRVATPDRTKDEVPREEVQEVGGHIINQLLFELQRSVFHRHRDGITEVPLLTSLISQVNQMTELLLQSTDKKRDWILRFLSFVSLYSGDDLTTDVLLRIISEATSPEQLSSFLRLQSIVEVKLGDILPRAVQKVTNKLRSHRIEKPLTILKNILMIMEWENGENNDKSKERSSFTYCIKSGWEAFIPLLSHSDLEIVMTTGKIMNILGMPSNISSPCAIHVSSALLSFFFSILDINDTKMSTSMFKVCRQCFKNLSKQNYAQFIVVRFLLENVIDKDVRHLFGGKAGDTPISDKKDNTSLFDENRQHGMSLTLPRSHSSVFHAGVIGQGLRRTTRKILLTHAHIKRNKEFLTDMLATCSQNHNAAEVEPLSPIKDVSMETESESPSNRMLRLQVSGDLCRMIGGLLTEMLTPDVLYNNRFWPEEESISMTVERDLYVFKQFEENPVLWDILKLYAGNSLAMSRCSPILKSLTAALMRYFETSRDKSTRDSPKQLEAVTHLIRCLSKSCLLPEPLKYVSELFPLTTPFETYLLLLSVWRYMKENPPTEDPEEVQKRVCVGRHLEIIRAILHSNINTMGHFYPRFFGALQCGTVQ
ncbi:hypothetical protein FSP39_008920 [Pinctada imbricata]|uniref:Integrator complex subunit 5 n=1 Tax=Pinctada imbricata TaxID=66713 RepID=A0AA88XUR8_PINIB|nr:hypothetical protein FSP39_008920 [Pinctada imbricata]